MIDDGLWAVISLIGFPLHEFRPDLAKVFWPVAGVLGGIASFLLGWRWGRTAGQGSMRIGRYHILHWSGMLIAIALIALLHGQGLMSREALPRIILVILALGWYTAGIYLVRGYLWIGVALGAAYLGLLYVPKFGWTGVGVVMAASLAWAALRGGRRGAQAA